VKYQELLEDLDLFEDEDQVEDATYLLMQLSGSVENVTEIIKNI
jgi:hypothetical protein